MKNPFISQCEIPTKKVYKHLFHPDSTRLNRFKKSIEPQQLPKFQTLPTPNECLMLAEMVELRKKVAIMEREYARRLDFTANASKVRYVMPCDVHDYIAAEYATHHTTRAFRELVNLKGVYGSIQAAMCSGAWASIVNKAAWVRENAAWKNPPIHGVYDEKAALLKPVFRLAGGFAVERSLLLAHC